MSKRTHSQRSRKWAKRRKQAWWSKGYYTLGEKCPCGGTIHYNCHCPVCKGTRIYPGWTAEGSCGCWYCPKDGSIDWDCHIPGEYEREVRSLEKAQREIEELNDD